MVDIQWVGNACACLQSFLLFIDYVLLKRSMFTINSPRPTLVCTLIKYWYFLCIAPLISYNNIDTFYASLTEPSIFITWYYIYRISTNVYTITSLPWRYLSESASVAGEAGEAGSVGCFTYVSFANFATGQYQWGAYVSFADLILRSVTEEPYSRSGIWYSLVSTICQWISNTVIPQIVTEAWAGSVPIIRSDVYIIDHDIFSSMEYSAL